MRNFKETFKKFFPTFYLKLSEIRNQLKCIFKAKKMSINSNKKKAYIFLAADYGNYGDIAITYAQSKYLSEVLPNYEIVEIPVSKFYDYYLFLKKIISKEDIITIIGGGNLGNLYEGAEEIRRKIISSFKNNLIVSFPQTILFTNDNFGKQSLRKSIKVYSKHNKLILFSREEKTYKDMKKYFDKNEVYFVPDIVFSLKNKVGINKCKNNNIGLCFRKDKERLLDKNEEEKIKTQLKEYNIKNISTTTSNDNIIYDKRYDQLFELLDKIKDVKVFITDRLHGMIFSYITQTPCIVFDNNNHKIKGTYEKWLKNCSYIRLIEEKDIKNLNKIVDEVIKSKSDNSSFDENFKKIQSVIENKINIERLL